MLRKTYGCPSGPDRQSRAAPRFIHQIIACSFMPRDFDIGIVTDEIARDLEDALETARGWGLRRLELREGSAGRFPFFTPAETALVERAVQDGALVTAVSPGLFKGAAGDEARLRTELDEVLPRAVEKALRFGRPLLIVFGFERYAGEPAGDRVRVLRAFERVAERADARGLQVVVENEPNFWVDTPAETVALLQELDHPALGVNWDPANLVWGGHVPTREDFDRIRPFLRNLHVKDCDPKNAAAPWTPVGRGRVPWAELIPWIVGETDLTHATLETHAVPLKAASEESLETLRELIRKM